jgi:hypothetical protein
MMAVTNEPTKTGITNLVWRQIINILYLQLLCEIFITK